MRSITIILVFFLTSCGLFADHLLIDQTKVQEIKIIKGQDTSLRITVSDPVVINGIVENCLNGAAREPLKFKANYQLIITERDTSYLIYVNGRSINLAGTTYRCECDVEKTLSDLIK